MWTTVDTLNQPLCDLLLCHNRCFSPFKYLQINNDVQRISVGGGLPFYIQSIYCRRRIGKNLNYNVLIQEEEDLALLFTFAGVNIFIQIKELLDQIFKYIVLLLLLFHLLFCTCRAQLDLQAANHFQSNCRLIYCHYFTCYTVTTAEDIIVKSIKPILLFCNPQMEIHLFVTHAGVIQGIRHSLLSYSYCR